MHLLESLQQEYDRTKNPQFSHEVLYQTYKDKASPYILR